MEFLGIITTTTIIYLLMDYSKHIWMRLQSLVSAAMIQNVNNTYTISLSQLSVCLIFWNGSTFKSKFTQISNTELKDYKQSEWFLISISLLESRYLVSKMRLKYILQGQWHLLASTMFRKSANQLFAENHQKKNIISSPFTKV